MSSAEIVAHHKSGHIVVAAALGCSLESVSMRQDESGEWSGKTFSRCYDDDDETRLRVDVIVRMAGAVADSRYRQSDDAPDGWHGDIERIADKLADHPDAEQLIHELLDVTEKLVDRHWDSICKVAEALRERGSLNAAQVRDLL